MMEIGLTEMRLFTMGMPNSLSICSPTATRFSALRQIFSLMRCRVETASPVAQSRSEMPMVMVRISRHWFLIMSMVCKISLVLMLMPLPSA